jgi:hypothetical protein
MKVLLSAFSCAPNQGSEPGLGWSWAVEVARLGHDVLVLTSSERQDAIEAELAGGRLPPTLRFEYFMPAWLARLQRKGLALGYESLTWHTVHLLWQFLLYGHVRREVAEQRFDLVHHITFSGIRHPTLLGVLAFRWCWGRSAAASGRRSRCAARSGGGDGSWRRCATSTPS